MTRQSFVNDITTFGELYCFCCDEGIYGFIEGYFSADSLNDRVSEDIRGELECGSEWTTIMNKLLEIEVDGVDFYYEHGGYLEFSPVNNDDFYEVKESVLEYYDENELWELIADNNIEVEDIEEYEPQSIEALKDYLIQTKSDNEGGNL